MIHPTLQKLYDLGENRSSVAKALKIKAQDVRDIEKYFWKPIPAHLNLALHNLIRKCENPSPTIVDEPDRLF